MLTPDNIVVLRACVYSASKLLIFATSTQKRILNPFFEFPLPTSLSPFVVSLWLLIMLLSGDQHGSQRKRQVLRPAFSLCLEIKMTTISIYRALLKFETIILYLSFSFNTSYLDSCISLSRIS